jgi:hypothetical protein|tara:strand:+ start:487 stop:789 length:303 start_codon:yes stop_codon:yes gene_type:complete
MGKKKQRTSQISKGERRTVSKQLTKAARREYKQDLSKVHANKMKAFFAGKDAYVTVPNPNTKETNKRFIKVRVQDEWFKGSDFKSVLAGPRKRKASSDDE